MNTNKAAAVFLGVVLMASFYFVWQQYQSVSTVSNERQEEGHEVESTKEEPATTTPVSTLTQADCDIAENPYDCDRERVLSQLGSPTRDERRGEIIEGEAVNTYRNEFWGFQFEYPKEWGLQEYTFGASYSLFNLKTGGGSTEETGPTALEFNVSLDRWWQRVFALDTADNISWHQSRLIGGEEWRYPDKLDASIQIPNKHYIFDLGDYWFTINITLGFQEPPYYQDEYAAILDSFQFIPAAQP